jgi:hypothetical protein
MPEDLFDESRAKMRRRRMERTWREKVAEIIVQPEFALLGTGIEALCEEASSAALEDAAKICIGLFSSRSTSIENIALGKAAAAIRVMKERHAAWDEDRKGDGRGACRWSQMDAWDFSDVWETECGQSFCCNEGGPGEDGIVFCCYYGKRIVVETALKEADDG